MKSFKVEKIKGGLKLHIKKKVLRQWTWEFWDLKEFQLSISWASQLLQCYSLQHFEIHITLTFGELT